MKNVPIPPAIKDCNTYVSLSIYFPSCKSIYKILIYCICAFSFFSSFFKQMGGVDHSDALIGFYEIVHKTKKWYKTIFYHFVDISIVNSYILYKAQCIRKDCNELETVVLELADSGSTKAAAQPQEKHGTHHHPLHISTSGDKTWGGLRCRKSQAKTPIKCTTCDIPLCFLPLRDCYNKWYVEKKNI